MAELSPVAQALEALLATQGPLELRGVADRGKPNEERVYLWANSRVYLGHYMLLAGIRLSDTDAVPLKNHSFWLGAKFVDPGTWVVVYTGAGAEEITKIRGTDQTALVLHWGFKETVFANSSVVPCLVRSDPATLQIGKI